jgi:hypothetical protein
MNLRSQVRNVQRAAGAWIRGLHGRSNARRWANSANLLADWEPRTVALAAMIPANSSVLEFGAGRLVLKRHLPEGCRYTPSDLVSRGEGTIVCDLNDPVPPEFDPHDVAVFSGVLEYIHNVPRLIVHLAPVCKMIVCSYATADTSVSSKLQRRSMGWVNDYTSTDFKRLFADHGFACDLESKWESQLLFRFQRS